METGLEGLGVLVTGGAGGIGSATVRAFADEGARVAVHYRTSRERADNLATEFGGVVVGGDLTVEDEADRVVAEALAGLGRLDILVANAGAWPEEDVPLWEMPLTRWHSTIAANLDSIFLSCRAFLLHVATTGHGNIVLVASTAGIFGEAGHADYSAAKAAIAGGLLKSLKNEIVRIAPLGRVNAVAPGWTRTEMSRSVIEDAEKIDRATRTMALDKVATSEDIAATIVFLASDRVSGHITGELITVAGGMEGRLLRD